MPGLRWVIITGEYPPAPGGVSDYTRLVAQGLAEAGDEVRIWAPSCARPLETDAGVTMHQLPDGFGLRGLATLDIGLRRWRPDRILVQYLPHAFGCKAMNLAFCLWLFLRRQQIPIWIMFHEVAYPLSLSQPLRHTILGITNRLMAFLATHASRRVFISIPAWEPMLRRISLGKKAIRWLPVPSNIPILVDPEEVSAARARIAPDADTLVVGHFGTFGPAIATLLRAILPPLLKADARRLGLLLGREGERFVKDMTEEHPALGSRLKASGVLPNSDVAVYMSACDILLQPYPDGVSSRRTSMMAGLALGLPIVTTEGSLTEPLWRESQAVALAPVHSMSAFISAADHLLISAQQRAELGDRAAALYAENFALVHTLNELRS